MSSDCVVEIYIIKKMNKNKTWGIIGLGWLGKLLSEKLTSEGFDAWGTRSSDFNFVSDQFPDKFCNVLFINTPPLIESKPEDFVNKIPFTLINENKNTHDVDLQNINYKNYKIDHDRFKVIFISSTSVYGDHQGLCDEQTTPEPKTANGKWLLEVENKLSKKFNDRLLIIRPGGLIGEDRHPIFSIHKNYSTNGDLSGGDNLINFIHRSDLIEIIIAAEKNNLSGILNAVSPHHPKRSEYYNYWTKKLKMNSIKFKSDQTTAKKVDSVILPSFYIDWLHKNLD